MALPQVFEIDLLHQVHTPSAVYSQYVYANEKQHRLILLSYRMRLQSAQWNTEYILTMFDIFQNYCIYYNTSGTLNIGWEKIPFLTSYSDVGYFSSECKGLDTKGESHFSVLPLPLCLTPSPCPSKPSGKRLGVKTYPYEMRRHLVNVTSSYNVASQLLRHPRRPVLIANSPSKSVFVSIAWVLVMFSLFRETQDCCANQQCNVSIEK